MGTATQVRKPITLDHLRKKLPAVGVQYIPIDLDVLTAANEAADLYSKLAVFGDDERTTKAKAALKTALDELHKPENSIRIDFKAMGRDKFDALKALHKPTEAQLAEAKETGERYEFNPETFLAPLVAATVSSPKMTPDDVRLLTVSEEDGGFGWTSGDVEALFNESIRVNVNSHIGSYSF